MRLACMVMAWRAAPVLAHAVPVFKAAGWDVFVHLDAKASAPAYRDALGSSAYACDFVEPVEVFWGGFSQLEATVRLIRAARAAGAYDKFLLITDDTLPLFPPAWLNAVLAQDRDFITAMAQPEGSPNSIGYQKFFFHDHPATMMRGHGTRSTEIDDRFLHAMTEIAAVRAIGKKAIPIAHGPAYFALSAASVASVMETIERDRHLLLSFAYSNQPDKTMIQSILRERVYRRDLDFSPVYADFHSQAGGPRVLDAVAALPFDPQAHHLFARKIAPSAGIFIAAVTARLLRGRTAWGTDPEEAANASFVETETGEALPFATVRLAAPAPGIDHPDWHNTEQHHDRLFRWSASGTLTWPLPDYARAPGRLRVTVPHVMSKPGMVEDCEFVLSNQVARAIYTRYSLIAEFEHRGLEPGTHVALRTPPPAPAAPPHDTRLLALGIATGP